MQSLWQVIFGSVIGMKNYLAMTHSCVVPCSTMKCCKKELRYWSLLGGGHFRKRKCGHEEGSLSFVRRGFNLAGEKTMRRTCWISCIDYIYLSIPMLLNNYIVYIALRPSMFIKVVQSLHQSKTTSKGTRLRV